MSWKNDPKDLPDNYKTLHKQFVSTEKRLLRDEELGKYTQKSLMITRRKDIFQKLMKVIQKKKWYLLHFPVIKPARDTSK